jgi:multiple sugar transport system permease protein
LKSGREFRVALFFLLPLLLMVLAFIAVPVAGTIFESFFRDVTFLPRRFLGVENYRALLADRTFYQALLFTLLFTFASVPLEMVLGMIFALVLNRSLPWRGLLRAAVLVPWAIPAVVSGRVFELIYNFSYGLANYLVLTLGLSDSPVNWLGSSYGAFASLVIADAWRTTPFAAIILLAGLSAIPGELFQQATIDGAGPLQQFVRITLPLLKPVLIVALLFRTIDALRVFDVVYVITGGGPGGTTDALSLYAYQYFLSGDFGYGSTISVVLFAVALSLAIFCVRLSGFRRELI